MGRCHEDYKPYASVEECLAAEQRAPQVTQPRGNAAAQEALRGRDGNYGQSGIRPPDAGPFGGKVVLTFDDGPDLEHTPQILAVLDKYGIKATFFVHGEQLDQEGALELAQQIRQQGHIVGNHTESHVLLGEGRRARPDLAEPQIGQTHDRLMDINDYDDPRFMRFPGGDENARSIGVAEGDGYAVTGWHVDSGDWCFDESQQRGLGEVCSPEVFEYFVGDRGDFVGSVVQSTQRFEGGILLFHDTRQFTAEHLEEVIVALKEAGFTFTNLDDADMLPILHAQQEALTPEVPVRPSPLHAWPEP